MEEGNLRSDTIWPSEHTPEHTAAVETQSESQNDVTSVTSEEISDTKAGRYIGMLYSVNNLHTQ